MNESQCKNVVVLGATGSIGDSCLDIMSRHPDKFKVVAITGHSNISKLASLCERFHPKYVVVSELKNRLHMVYKTNIEGK